MNARRFKRKSVAGMSMLEVLVATSILGVVMLMTYVVLMSTSSTTARGHLTGNLEARGKQFVNRCKVDFVDARFDEDGHKGLYGIHDNGTQIHYQTALRSLATGTVEYGMIGGSLTFVSGVPDYTPWIGCSAIIRFEPELVLLEPNAVDPGLKQMATANPGGPTDWQPNRYVIGAPKLLPTVSPYPTLRLKRDFNKDTDSTQLFIKGTIWKYIMPPNNPNAPTAFTLLNVLKSERLSDDVVLRIRSDGKFVGDIDGPGPTPPGGKDMLFRYLKAEPLTPEPYGNTDYEWMAMAPPMGVYPGANSVCIMVTVTHAVEDDSGKGTYFLRKAWERIPFRLSKLN